MLDGGEVQQLFTYGVEGTHWSAKAEEVCGNKYEEGQFHGLENLEKPGTQYTKNHIDPLLSISNFDKFEDPGAKEVAKETREAQELFNSHSRLVDLVPSTDVMSQFNGDLITLKREIIANVVTQGLSIDDEMKRFEEEGGAEWSKAIADSMNGK